MTEAVKNRGWQVTLSGLGINLALGVLYSWSVISAEIGKAGWAWSDSAFAKSLPYSVACFVFCLTMVPAGRMQDKLSPKIVASIGGLLVGIGMIFASLVDPTQSSLGYVIGFGVIAGAGIGFGYAAATPPAVKWFPKAKTGMIAGIVVCGFGLAPVYTSYLCKWLAGFGLNTMMMALGIGFLIVVGGLAQLLVPPPPGFVPEGEVTKKKTQKAPSKEDFTPSEMLKTWQFFVLWFMYACGAGAGLMVISSCKGIVTGAGVSEAAALAAVAFLAIGNGGGRVVAGALSDKLGRNKTMLLFFLLQALVIFGLSVASSMQVPSALLLIVLATLVGANYGSNLALFPSITKDYFGSKNFGVNYGLIFTAWGIGGLTLSMFAAKVKDGSITWLGSQWAGNYNFAFYTASVLLLLGALLTFVVKAPDHEKKEDPAPTLKGAMARASQVL